MAVRVVAAGDDVLFQGNNEYQRNKQFQLQGTFIRPVNDNVKSNVMLLPVVHNKEIRLFGSVGLEFVINESCKLENLRKTIKYSFEFYLIKSSKFDRQSGGLIMKYQDHMQY